MPSAEGRAASLVFVKPNRVLERVGLRPPKRIAELRLEVFANLDESTDIKVELEATSAEAANDEQKSVSAQMHDFFSDVWMTTSALRALSGANSGDSHLETAPRLDLEVDERTLGGKRAPFSQPDAGHPRPTLVVRLPPAESCEEKALVAPVTAREIECVWLPRAPARRTRAPRRPSR